MVPTIFIKVCEFIVHSKPNNMTLSGFPGKITETRKIVFNFLSVASPNVACKLNDQSRSNSICRIPLQVSLALFFIFDLPTKLRVVHIRKIIKIFIFSKMLQRSSSNFVGLLHIRISNIWPYRFSRKNPCN